MSATTPTRLKATYINALPIEDSLPFAKFSYPQLPIQHRISDAFLGKLYSASAIVEGRKARAAELAPISFTAKTMNLRSTGQSVGLGSPFIYEGKYATLNGHVLRGTCTLNLQIGAPLESLVDDPKFQTWVQNMMFGEYAAFTPAVIGNNMALLTSVSSTAPGCIGSPIPPAPGPHFGVPLARFSPAASAPLPSAQQQSGLSVATAQQSSGQLHSAATAQPVAPPAAVTAQQSGPLPSANSQQPSAAESATDPAALNQQSFIPSAHPAALNQQLSISPAHPAALDQQPSVSSAAISTMHPAATSSPQHTPLTAPVAQMNLFGNSVLSFNDIAIPKRGRPITKSSDLTEEEEEEAQRLLSSMLGSASHNRTVSLPVFPTKSLFFLDKFITPLGFMLPTQNTSHTEIQGPVEDAALREEEQFTARTKEARSNTNSNASMSGMTHYTDDSKEFYRRAIDAAYVPTSPSFGSTPRNASPMSLTRRTNSTNGQGSNNSAELSTDTAVKDFAADEEYHGRDTESANDLREAEFQVAYDRAIAATRAACIPAKKAVNIDVADARINALDKGLVDVIEDEYKVISELRGQSEAASRGI